MGKVYTVLIALFSLFAFYYQYITSGFTLDFSILGWITNIILLLAGYSYFYKKPIFVKSTWGVIFKLLMLILFINFIFQITPSNYVGDFSILNGYLITNIFVYLISIFFFLPLYFATFRLAYNKKK
jgi:hypothetical protein